MATDKNIFVLGDLAIDWFQYPVKPDDKKKDEKKNWQLYAANHARALPGGALLLADFIKAGIKYQKLSARVFAPKLNEKISKICPENILHSNVLLKARKRDYIIDKYLGYIGPKNKSGQDLNKIFKQDIAKPDIIVLDDAGNEFRHAEDAWPQLPPENDDTIVVYKMCRPLSDNKLWEKIQSLKLKNLVVVLNANDLRKTEGVQISKTLSWERSAKDCLFELNRSIVLNSLQQCAYLVVLFDTDGVILHRGGNDSQAMLIFDPDFQEGGFAAEKKGKMMGKTALFTAALVAEMTKHRFVNLERSIQKSLNKTRKLLETGFEFGEKGIEYPMSKIFNTDGDKLPYTSCKIEPDYRLDDPDPHFWRVMDQRTRCTRVKIAEELVINKNPLIKKQIPAGKFGDLYTIDRAEIEHYGAIRELIAEYLSNPKPKNPLSFAVYGPPGSGKSFGVKQVVKSLNTDDVQSVTFNISQFQGYHDLVEAFHKVRDISLEGKIPFVFFDEFDSGVDDKPLAWLKYFLAPMQDAEFSDGGAIHPIGKAIFVFAGGTKSTFQEFEQNISLPELEKIESEQEKNNKKLNAADQFRMAKGPDFVSRLRGFINVMGPNRQRTETDDDDAFILRRAIILRVTLKLDPTAKNLFNSEDELQIDSGVLQAMLHIKEYLHGARSMAAVVEMSRLAGKYRFDLSALPSRDQLALHVDADEFLFLTHKERFFPMLRLRELEQSGIHSNIEFDEKLVNDIAEAIHEDYREQRAKEGEIVESYNKLSDDMKQSNLNAAVDIPAKLRKINYGIRRIVDMKNVNIPDISDEDVEKLARWEHVRFCCERRLQGWKYGPVKDKKNKISPYLISYDELPEDIKQYDVQAIYAIPVVLKKVGFEIYRMEEAETLQNPELIEKLARIIHKRYVEERIKDGDNIETNKALCDYEDLPEDLKEANLDNAASVFKKLKSIGYEVKPLLIGDKATKVELTSEEIEELSVMEHARWNWQKIMQGWVYKEGDKDTEKKTTPYLVPWENLADEIREYDRESVRLIPALLEEADYVAYKTNTEF